MKAKKNLLVVMAAAGLLGAAGSALADGAKAPIRLSDALMDQIVAGAIFTDTITTTTQGWVHGYSNTPAAPNARGASLVETTTTSLRTMDCPGGNINSCYAPGQETGLTPETQVLSVTPLSSSSTFLSGPGRSFGHRF